MADEENMLDEKTWPELDELDSINENAQPSTEQESKEKEAPSKAKKTPKKSVSALEKALKIKSDECEDWKQKFERVRTLAKKIRDENQEMKEKFEDYEEACDTIEKLENALAASDVMSIKRKNEIEKLQEEMKKYKDSPEGKVTNLNQTAETRSLQSELLNCKTELLQYKKIMGPDHQKFLKKLELQISKLNSENKSLRQKNQRFTASSTLQSKQSESFELASLTIDLAAAKTRYQTAEAELKVLTNEIEKIKSENLSVELTQTKIDFKASQAKCQALSNALKKLQAEIGRIKSDQPGKTEFSKLTVELKTALSKLAAAEDMIIKYQSKESKWLDSALRSSYKRKDLKALNVSLAKKRKLATILD